MRWSLRRSLAAALSLGTLAVGATTFGATAADDLIACRTKGAIQIRKDGWTRISAPEMDTGEGPRKIIDYAVTPVAPNRIYVTNGVVIKLSADGGCTWNFLTGGSNNRVPGVDQQEPDVYTSIAAPDDNTLWITSYDDEGGVHHPHVYQGQDLGPQTTEKPTYPNVDLGLPAVGTPIDIMPAGSVDQGMAYVVIDTTPDPASGDVETPTRHVYTTTVHTDPPPVGGMLGRIWQEVKLPTTFGRLGGIAPSPYGATLWAWSGKQYAFTKNVRDDSPTWTTGTMDGPISALDVNRIGIATVVAKAGSGSIRRTVDNDGKILNQASKLPLVPTEIAHGLSKDWYAITGPTGTWGYDVRMKRWVDITPKGVGTLRGLQSAPGLAQRYLVGQTDTDLYRFDTFDGETFIKPPDRAFTANYPKFPVGTIKEPFIDPADKKVVVKPGEIKDVDVTFGMPPAATPLDVYFLMDTTGSMGIPIASLKADVTQIAARMRKELGQSVCFGVGSFKDFNTNATTVTNVFDTYQKITCEGPDLPKVRAGIAKMNSSAGGDRPEAQTVALTQAITGAGSLPYVAADQDAEFRPEAFKIIVLITDAEFHKGGNYPTMDATIQTLHVAGVKVVSVQVMTDNQQPEIARADMEELAVGTDSLAPAGGVDCDGDGKRTQYDLSEGDPLICETSGSEPNIGPVISTLLLGVEDPGTVAVKVTDPFDVTRDPIQGPTSRIMNLKRQSVLPFSVPVSCTTAQDGLDLPVDLAPTVRALPVLNAHGGGYVHGRFTVQCRSTPPLPKLPPPPPRIPPDPPVDRPPLPRPPPALALVPPPNPPVQPISNINPNAGFSQQEEEQFQVATVTQGAQEEEQEEELELAMSAVDRDQRDATSGALLAGGALVLSTGVGIAYRRRLQRSHRFSSVRA
jgi:hypothetical protein